MGRQKLAAVVKQGEYREIDDKVGRAFFETPHPLEGSREAVRYPSAG
jgi:hypothetical protein